jgi:hypothetical protein
MPDLATHDAGFRNGSARLPTRSPRRGARAPGRRQHGRRRAHGARGGRGDLRRISTDAAHRRRGLGRAVMCALGGSGRLCANGRVVGHHSRPHTALWEHDQRVMTHRLELDGQRCGERGQFELEHVGRQQHPAFAAGLHRRNLAHGPILPDTWLGRQTSFGAPNPGITLRVHKLPPRSRHSIGSTHLPAPGGCGSEDVVLAAPTSSRVNR